MFSSVSASVLECQSPGTVCDEQGRRGSPHWGEESPTLFHPQDARRRASGPRMQLQNGM